MTRHLAYNLRFEWLELSVRQVRDGHKHSGRAIVEFDVLLSVPAREARKIIQYEYAQLERRMAVELASSGR